MRSIRKKNAISAYYVDSISEVNTNTVPNHEPNDTEHFYESIDAIVTNNLCRF